MFFMGVTNAIFVALSVPLSMFIAFLIMPSIGFTFNMIALQNVPLNLMVKTPLMTRALTLLGYHLRYRLWIADLNADIAVLRIAEDHIIELQAQADATASAAISKFKEQFAGFREEIDQLKHEMHQDGDTCLFHDFMHHPVSLACCWFFWYTIWHGTRLFYTFKYPCHAICRLYNAPRMWMPVAFYPISFLKGINKWSSFLDLLTNNMIKLLYKKLYNWSQ